MHQRRLYALSFLLVLLAGLAGAFLARRWVSQVEVPQVNPLPQARELLDDVNLLALIPRRPALPAPAATQPAPNAAATAQPIVERDLTPQPAAIAATAPVTGSLDGATPEPVATDTPPAVAPTPAAPAVDAAYLYVAAAEVQHSSGDCPGASIRGAVRDAAGTPLPGVRLWRYDQWGNEQVVESKAGEVDLGQYDLPLSDTPNVHYVQVVDAGGTIVSPVLKVEHRQGSAPDATCHWIDWVKR